jgi:hypothetical protein
MTGSRELEGQRDLDPVGGHKTAPEPDEREGGYVEEAGLVAFYEGEHLYLPKTAMRPLTRRGSRRIGP